MGERTDAICPLCELRGQSIEQLKRNVEGLLRENARLRDLCRVAVGFVDSAPEVRGRPGFRGAFARRLRVAAD